MNCTHYGIGFTDVGQDGLCRAWEVLVDLLGDQLVTVLIDPYSDDKDLPPEVAAAQEELVELLRQRRSTPRRGWLRFLPPRSSYVPFDPQDPRQLALLRTFGAYSRNIEGYGADPDRGLLYVHDGAVIVFCADPDVLAEFLRLSGLPPEFVVPTPMS